MYEQVCYEKSFLKQVIVKVDFASPLIQLEKGVPSKLLNTIVETFPIVEPGETLKHQVSLDRNGVQSKQTTLKHWSYFGRDRQKQLTLSPESVFALYSVYQKYEETKEQFGSVIDSISKAFPDAKASRFGLRYVNQIDLPFLDESDGVERLHRSGSLE